MTVQASDSIIHKRKKYYLIDIEKGKDLIGSADFGVTTPKDIVMTCCYRNYIAEYFIEKKILYGIKNTFDIECDGVKDISSDKHFMNFTGNIIVARNKDSNKWWNTDFFECLLDFDEAIELHFENGMLVNESSLSGAIAEWSENADTEYPNWQEKSDAKMKVIKKYLTAEYNYGKTYKWK